jgi:hypothetical protein
VLGVYSSQGLAAVVLRQELPALPQAHVSQREGRNRNNAEQLPHGPGLHDLHMARLDHVTCDPDGTHDHLAGTDMLHPKHDNYTSASKNRGSQDILSVSVEMWLWHTVLCILRICACNS